MPMSTPRTMPFTTPTEISLSQTQAMSAGLMMPSASSRSDTATAWLPEQPLMSETMGRKIAMAMTAASVSS